jgi:glycosyltransferase involved in cell wall biosynthesis
MKTIILDCDLMRYPNSGLYYYCLHLGNYVQKQLEHEQSGKMKYYLPNKSANKFLKKGNSIVEKKYHNYLKPFIWNCDIWHAPFQSGRLIPDKKIHKNLKVVLTIHDLNALHEGRSAEQQQRDILHTQQLIDKSNAIVCISEFTRNDVMKHCEVGNKPVYVIYNGSSELMPSFLNQLSYKPARPFIFGMGYVNPKKNYHVLIPILKYNENVELIIAGRLDDPDYIANMYKTASELGVEERLHILGPVTDNEKSWYLNNCEAFMHPSKAEGFGLPVIEAMSVGKPVFLSNLTSLPEIAGSAAFYFLSFEEQHIQQTFFKGMQLFKDNMDEITMSLKKRSHRFNWEKSAAAYIKIYKSLY